MKPFIPFRSSSFASTATNQQVRDVGRRKRPNKGGRRKSRNEHDSVSEGSGSRGSRNSEFNKYGSHEDLQSIDQESMDLASSHSSDKDTITYTEEHGQEHQQGYSDSEGDDQNETFDEDTVKLHREQMPGPLHQQVHHPQMGPHTGQHMHMASPQSPASYDVSGHEHARYSPREGDVHDGPDTHRPYSGTGRGGSVMGHHDESMGYSGNMSLSRTATLPLATRMLLSDSPTTQHTGATSPDPRGWHLS